MAAGPIDIQVDGITFGLITGLTSETYVLVPVSCLETKDPERLVKAARLCGEYAIFFDAYHDAQHCGVEYQLQCPDGYEFLREKLMALKRFAGLVLWEGTAHSASADKTIEAIEGVLRVYDAKNASQAAKKQACKRRRSEFTAARPQVVLALIERDGYECSECRCAGDLQVDHILPLSRGGGDEMANLRFLCGPCNARKGDRIKD